jgi:predicted ester cyclase
MIEKNRSLVIRWFEEVWNQRLASTVHELFSSSGIGYMEGAKVVGPAEFIQARDILLTAFPDIKVNVNQIVAEGDSVVVRWSAAGTHLGDNLGFRATSTAVTFSGMTWLRLVNGQIVEGWDAWNQGQVVEMLRAKSTESTVASR